MARSFRLGFVLATLLADISGAAQVGTPTLVSIQTPRGATQAFILIEVDNPVASVILFTGGHGALGLKSASPMKWGSDGFLVRSRDQFADHRFMVAVVDAPSDQQQGMNPMFRMSGAHAGDIGAVAAYLKKQKDIPVWLVGTSMGTFSAARGAIAAKGIDGLVLTSTITRAMPEWMLAKSHSDGVASMALQEITAPTLIVSHRKDACKITPAADAPKPSKRLINSAQCASGSGRTWMCTARGLEPFPPSLSHGVRSPFVLHNPRPFQPAFGSSMRPSNPLAKKLSG